MKLVVAALSAALATACTSSNGATKATPSPATSSSAAGTPTPTTSTSLESVLESSARAFYDEATRAAATGDVSRLRAMALPTCACQQLVKFIAGKWERGSLRGASFVIDRVGAAQIEPKVKIVPIYRSVTAYEVLDQNGRVVERVPAEPVSREDVYLRMVNGTWIIENIVVPGS